MSEFKHTPGPWELSGPMGTEHLHGAEPWFWVSADRTLHLRVAACSDGYVVGENEANARLIAAAPDLLEALQEIAAMTGYVDCDICTDVRITADAAIAKATGAGHE